ncbi:MAG: hypothetical protein E6K80_08990, partial [Candidatus Eisenbacteria bacterium]
MATTSLDTTGWMAIDTGAGFLALDAKLAIRLGVLDTLPARAVDFALRPLARLVIGDLTSDQISPVAVFDSDIVTRVTDHGVLGLLGYHVFRDRVIWIDYDSRRIALVPAGTDTHDEDALAVADSRRGLGGVLSRSAIPTRFRMTVDGKILLRARVTPNQGGRATPWLNLVLDTGASKSTLFEDLVDARSHTEAWRPAIKGLVAPTL